MADLYNIAIIGSGNLAWHLAPELENAGHHILEVFSRSPANAKSLQKRLYSAVLKTSFDFSHSKATIFIICVADDAIEEVARELVLPENVIIVHTSGSRSINSLGYTATDHIGVFYPLQTFSKGNQIVFTDIPILIEAENNHTEKILNTLGKSISRKVITVNSLDRMAIHISAVFACNFTNHLIGIAESILQEQGFGIELLRPLIVETINKSLDIGPERAQTGPAARGDLEILDKHMAHLKGTDYEEIYKLISEKILHRFS